MDVLPIKITPCPIVETVLEIRFSSLFPSEVIYGLFFNPLKEIFDSNIEKLPMAQIPDLIRNQDPNFKFKPYFRVVKDNTVFQFAPDLINIININSYLGWDVFFEKIKTILDSIASTNVINKIERISLRYIDFFELDIIDKINLDINLNNSILKSNEIFLRAKIENEEVDKILQVSNSAMIVKNSLPINGSTLDIDISLKDYSKVSANDKENLYSLIDKLHTEEKETFFQLLKEDFLKTLNPKYT